MSDQPDPDHVICGECMLRYAADECPNCGAEVRWHET